jgi:ABC-type antimicrobial peptide transport system permease subunit
LEANQIVDGLGFYPIKIDMPVLGAMFLFGNAILMLGLIFDIIIMLFIILSILLIYSLLMISVESKTFEFGVMRMIGLSKSGIVSMIVIQAFMFVIPSVICAFAVTPKCLEISYEKVFTADMGMDVSTTPSNFAIF